ncbi:hypothetical protein RSSM_05606 [Rhodopirellula sallentina SM41]|uniref:Uncharacterized protein n=1 Tax=Rhodopirellula sallentina SM41 TaxID=1263870 RepID=M5UAB5_9BACT|nr:hypothetical protein RSSM_05606 [Rhodopirellula sallentina SM41]
MGDYQRTASVISANGTPRSGECAGAVGFRGEPQCVSTRVLGELVW